MTDAKQLEPGLRCSRTITVTDDMLVPNLPAAFTGLDDMPPVFATVHLVSLVEWSCIELLRPYMAPGMGTVGVRVDVKHLAATPVGMQVTAEVELTAVNGRMLEFSVTCRDEVALIGEAIHQRAIIDKEKFLARLPKGK